MNIETLAVHAGHEVDSASGAISPPINLSTTFERDPDGGYGRGFVYSREDNPNRRALEKSLAALEGGADACAFASGSAAAMSILQTLSPGDHILVPDDMYFGTTKLLREVFTRWRLESTAVDMSEIESVSQHFRATTKLVWIETPSNPQLKITDIARVTELAHQKGAVVVCDNTWATPVLQSPLQLGADFVLHSTTKYLSGHSDVIGGVVVARTRDSTFDAIRTIQHLGGAVPSPFDCWLLQRSIPTLPYRMRAHSSNAHAVAEFLLRQDKVEAVHYPGLPTSRFHEVASRQMRQFGGMISIQLAGGAKAAIAVASGVSIFKRATSLGGVESLIEHRASMEGPGTRTPDNLLRISVGLEHPDDLIEDLKQALASV